jgi:hypothetical protein
MPSSGKLRSVALVRNCVSEECIASFVRVTRIGEIGTTLAVTSDRRKLSVLTRATLRKVPEDGVLHSHHSENAISDMIILDFRSIQTLHRFKSYVTQNHNTFSTSSVGNSDKQG